MKSTLISLALFVLFLTLPTVSASAQSQDDAYKQTLKTMMTASGVIQTSETLLTQMIVMMKQNATGVADSFWDDFAGQYKEKFQNRMTELYIPIYQKYLTIDDLKQIIAFYESPVGKKLASVTPAMTAEGMQLGQQLGMEIATQIQKELKAKENQ